MRKLIPFLANWLVVSCCLFHYSAIGQQYGSLPNILTPEVASLGKFGSYPVGYYTGSPNISIPLYSLKESDITIDMSLIYDGSGFIPNKEPGITGLNWSLLAGGVITRTVNWAPDDLNEDNTRIMNTHKGYIYGMKNANLGIFAKEYVRKLDFLTFGSGWWPNSAIPYEYAPDVFSFNFNGHAGKFFLGNDGNVKISSNRNYKVDLTNFSGQNDLCQVLPSEITITTDEGDAYTFGGDINTLEISYPYLGESSPRQIQCRGGSINAWHLRKIRTRNGREITFNYEEQSKDDLAFAETHHGLGTLDYAYEKLYLNDKLEARFNDGYSYSNTSGTRYRTALKTVYLSSIVSSTQTINFLYSQKTGAFYGTNEIVQNPNLTKQLNKMEVVDYTGKKVRTIAFLYENVGSTVSGYRQFLKKVTQSDGTSINSSAYTLDYNLDQTLPSPLTTGIDLWGYYNGKDGNGSLIPSGSSGPPEYNTDMSRRVPDAEYSKRGMLRKITYPTGGYSEFTFEGNTYGKALRRKVSSGMIPVMETVSGEAGGLRIKEIKNSEGNTRTFYYTKNWEPNTSVLTSSGILTDHMVFYIRLNFYFNNFWPDVSVYVFSDNNIAASGSYGESHIGYGEVAEVSSDGYTKYYYTTQETKPDKYDLGFDSYKLTPGSDVSINNCNYFGQMKRLVKHSMCDMERGQLVTTELYDNNKVKIKEVINEYNTDPARYDQSVYGFSFPHGNYTWAIFHSYALYHFQTGITKETVRDFSNGVTKETITNFKYVSNSNPLLTERSQINSKNETITQKLKYPFDTEFAATAPYNTMISRHIIAPVVKDESYKGATTLLSMQKINYKLWPNNVIAPELIQVQTGTGPLETKMRFHAYDNYGNILSASKETNEKTSWLWDHKNSYPVAVAQRVNPNEIFFNGFESEGWDAGISVYDKLFKHSGNSSGRINKPTSGAATAAPLTELSISLSAATKFKFSGWMYTSGPVAKISLIMKRTGETGAYTYTDFISTSTTGKWIFQEKEYTVPADVVKISVKIENAGSGTVWFDDIRVHPSVARLTTYSVSPGIGINAQADPNNRYSYFEYDGLGRLILIRDQDNNIVKRYCYNYAGQSTTCQLYTNTAKSQSYTRNNCGPGYIGGSYNYTVPAGKYYGSTPEEAEAKAQADLDQNGQLAANTNGACNPLIIYAKMFYSNYTYDPDFAAADIHIKFFSDEACTVPYSVNNLTVKYRHVETMCGWDPTYNSYSVVCNGTQYFIGHEWLDWDDGIHCEYYSFQLEAGTGYVIN